MIYYSHVNEDNLVEKHAIHDGAFTQLFCVAGSGERVMALLDAPDLRQVFIVDPNPEALYLTELKVKALLHLDTDAYLQFVGFGGRRPENALDIYRKLAGNLSPACRNFWDQHPAMIQKGILHIGYFERFLARARPLLRLWLGKSFYRLFERPELRLGGMPAFRWGILRWCFAQNLTYRLLGNHDIAFVGRNADLKKIPAGIDRTLDTGTFGKSFMNHLILRGKLTGMPDNELPPSLNSLHLQKVKSRLAAIDFHFIREDMLSALQALEPAALQQAFYSLSDLLSFEDPAYIGQILVLLQNSGSGAKKVVLRAFVRNRLDKTGIRSVLEKYGEVSVSTAEEQTAMYQVLEINIKNKQPVPA